MAKIIKAVIIAGLFVPMLYGMEMINRSAFSGLMNVYSSKTGKIQLVVAPKIHIMIDYPDLKMRERFISTFYDQFFLNDNYFYGDPDFYDPNSSTDIEKIFKHILHATKGSPIHCEKLDIFSKKVDRIHKKCFKCKKIGQLFFDYYQLYRKKGAIYLKYLQDKKSPLPLLPFEIQQLIIDNIYGSLTDHEKQLKFIQAVCIDSEVQS
jgi:hypothetical protein